MQTTTHRSFHRDYSQLAADYDRLRFETPSGRFLARTDAKIIRDFVRQAGCNKILDVPTGTGRVFEYLSDFPGTIVGCDLTEEMCDIARTKAKGSAQSVMLGDASNLPFPDADFDCLVSLNFFHLFPRADRMQFASEFSRVVRPGGYVICSFTNGWYAGGINWIRRGLGRKTVQFQYRGEIAKLFPNWTVVGVRGNFLPLQWRIANVSESCERLSQWAVFHTPLKYLCWGRFYLLQKPE